MSRVKVSAKRAAAFMRPPRACLLQFHALQGALDLAAQRLSNSPAGIAPWYFDGSSLNLSASDWRGADQILVPLAFNALGIREWQKDYAMDTSARQRFLERFDFVCAELLSTLPSFSERPDAHVFIQWGDLEWDLPCLAPGRVFKVSSFQGGATEAMPYFIKDLEKGREEEETHLSIREVTSRCSFTGNLDTHPLRRRLAKVIEYLDPAGISVKLDHTVAGQAAQERSRYLQSLREACFVLCPRGGGLNSARFYETLAMGRIPILISDHTKLPLEDMIPYHKFVLFMPETELDSLLDRVELFEQTHDLEIASRLARQYYWHQLRYERFFQVALAHDG